MNQTNQDQTNQDQINQIRDHYEQITKQSEQTQRNKSLIFYLKQTQNWIKSACLNHLMTPLPLSSCLLDMCGGKGGDLLKYQYMNSIAHVILFDISKESVMHAQKRFQSIDRPHFSFHAGVIDCFRPHKIFQTLKGHVDVVTCQFAIHYACDSEFTISQFLTNVSSVLKPNGTFLFTCPDGEKLIEFQKLYPNHPLCTIHFNHSPANLNEWGQSYQFSLVDSVNKCNEFIVPHKKMIDLAKKCNLEYMGAIGFMEIISKFHNRFRSDDISSYIDNLSREELQVMNLYKVWTFIKN